MSLSIKIDVEGHEAAVLPGATATIDRERPRIVIEIEQRHLDCPISDIFDQIRVHGYRGWFEGRNSRTPGEVRSPRRPTRLD